jgi:glucuronide carrier protein
VVELELHVGADLVLTLPALRCLHARLRGYVSGKNVVQTESAVHAVKLAAGFVPAFFLVVSLAIMAIYPLTEARFRQIVRETAERRIARMAPTSGAPAADA